MPLDPKTCEACLRPLRAVRSPVDEKAAGEEASTLVESSDRRCTNRECGMYMQSL